MSAHYIDRWGKVHKPGAGSIIRPRAGVFAIIIAYDHILLSWPRCAPDVPELPGGGIEAGEDVGAALVRELEEEADVRCAALSPVKQMTQEVKFYANFDGEFWDYHQTYWRVDAGQARTIYFEGETQPTDALKAAWVPLADVAGLNMHAIHAQILTHMLHI